MALPAEGRSWSSVQLCRLSLGADQWSLMDNMRILLIYGTKELVVAVLTRGVAAQFGGRSVEGNPSLEGFFFPFFFCLLAEFCGLHRSFSIRKSHSLPSHLQMVCVQSCRFTSLPGSGAELLGCSFSPQWWFLSQFSFSKKGNAAPADQSKGPLRCCLLNKSKTYEIKNFCKQSFADGENSLLLASENPALITRWCKWL